MSARVHVVGHRNPDTDSIASAIAYAELKRLVDPDTDYVSARLGPPNPQTTWALERSGAETPALLRHIYLRVGDVMRYEFPVAHDEDSVRVAGRMMADAGLDLLPVIGDDGALAGVLTERALARRYVRESHQTSRLEAPTTVPTIAETLDGTLLTKVEHTAFGRVWVLAMDVATMLGDVAEGDVAVVGDREDAQRRAIETDVAVLVLSNGARPTDDVLALAEEHRTSVITTPLDSYVAGRMITLASPCKALIETEPLTARTDDLVADILEAVKDVSYRAAVAVDGARRPIGLVTRADLVSPRPRKVILVDHAEQAQSVPGVEQAEIVEILDHHHIGSIETKLPVVATFDPVGSTATLVAERFKAAGHEPTPETATMLLAAVLSDTVILNSPTTTARDRAVIDALGERLGVDPLEFGREMFAASSDVSDVPPAQLVARDAKSYELAGGQQIRIAQIEVVGDGIDGRLPELRKAVADARDEDDLRLFALMVTDVLAHGTRLVVAGDVSYAERALGAPAKDGVIDLPGVMSRKKQVAPRLLAG
ncbi:MAG TPA: putative manganese-dependent inorganic diphosphatase [Solirubrobacteraceae bacterium]